MKGKYDIYDYADNPTTLEYILCEIANELAELNKNIKQKRKTIK